MVIVDAPSRSSLMRHLLWISLGVFNCFSPLQLEDWIVPRLESWIFLLYDNKAWKLNNLARLQQSLRWEKYDLTASTSHLPSTELVRSAKKTNRMTKFSSIRSSCFLWTNLEKDSSTGFRVLGMREACKNLQRKWTLRPMIDTTEIGEGVCIFLAKITLQDSLNSTKVYRLNEFKITVSWHFKSITYRLT